jgi:hypothetical protein
MDGLSAAELADLAGTTVAEVQRLVDLGILVARDGGGPLRASDVRRVRLVQACERAGLPLDGIAAAIREGRLSLVVLEGAPYRRWAVRSRRTCRQVSQDTGIPLEVLGGILESMGFARMAPDEPIREDELEEVVPLLRLARSLGNLDQVGLTRMAAPGRRACAWPPRSRSRTTPPASPGCWSPAATGGPPWSGLATSVGTAVTAFIPTAEAAQPLLSLSYFPVMLLSGVLGTLSGAPGWLTTLLGYLPGRPTVEAVTGALHATGGTLWLPGRAGQPAQVQRAQRVGPVPQGRRDRVPLPGVPGDGQAVRLQEGGQLLGGEEAQPGLAALLGDRRPPRQ